MSNVGLRTPLWMCFLLSSLTLAPFVACGGPSGSEPGDRPDTDTDDADSDSEDLGGAGPGSGGSGDGTGGRTGSGTGGRTGSGSGGEATEPPKQADEWSDFESLLVKSDGSQALGTPGDTTITGRDAGSKIVYFDVEIGDNATGEAYYWDGEQLIDGKGSSTNASGDEYGSDPFEPNLNAIKPLHDVDGNLANGYADPRVRLTYHDFGQMAAGYPDWFLFRRGEKHTSFKLPFEGGRSSTAPMLVGGYGPISDGRSIIDPDESDGGVHPLHLGPRNGQSPVFAHLVVVGIDIVDGLSGTGLNEAESVNPDGDPSSLFVEDCSFTKGSSENGMRIVYPPQRTKVRRSAIGFSWNPDSHNQGYYTAGADAQTIFDEVIFYRNGYKSDPRLNADPLRDQFSRNVYEGGGARMGHSYKGIISADGASGGPQMRFGGLIENSLVIEGYWFSSTDSNSTENPWTTLQEGESAIVRGNVQLVLDYPSPADPDPDGSSDIAQPGGGYTVQGSSFGATIENNIISGAMQVKDLNAPPPQQGISVSPWFNTYPDGQDYTLKDVTISKNIVYEMNVGFAANESWTGVTGVHVFDNVFASRTAVQASNTGPTDDAQLTMENNRFYVDEGLPDASWVGEGNEVAAMSSAAASEEWSDPGRTMRGYVEEVLNLELLDWDDDPYLDPSQAADRSSKQESYDPTGVKTFMAVAMTMRNGGTVPIPSEGKPTIDADYPWDERFTGTAVVNWIREGFNLPKVE